MSAGNNMAEIILELDEIMVRLRNLKMRLEAEMEESDGVGSCSGLDPSSVMKRVSGIISRGNGTAH